MNLRLGAALGSTIALLTGVLTIIGLLVNPDIFAPIFGPSAGQALATVLALPSRVFIAVVTTTVAVTVLIGIINLLVVHLERVARRQRGMLYSLVLVASFLASLSLSIAGHQLSRILLEDVQVAIESALAGLVFFALVYGAYRALERRITWGRILFVVSILVTLAGALPIAELGIVADISQRVLAIPVNAGTRAILLGIALAILVTGIRVLLGQDRSYRE